MKKFPVDGVLTDGAIAVNQLFSLAASAFWLQPEEGTIGEVDAYTG